MVDDKYVLKQKPCARCMSGAVLIVDRYVGLILAVSSSLAIGKHNPSTSLSCLANMLRPGTSFVITKKVRRPIAPLAQSSSARPEVATCKSSG